MGIAHSFTGANQMVDFYSINLWGAQVWSTIPLNSGDSVLDQSNNDNSTDRLSRSG
jgi:hypothetical protein